MREFLIISFMQINAPGAVMMTNIFLRKLKREINTSPTILPGKTIYESSLKSGRKNLSDLVKISKRDNFYGRRGRI